jgi:hypothetical protein
MSIDTISHCPLEPKRQLGGHDEVICRWRDINAGAYASSVRATDIVTSVVDLKGVIAESLRRQSRPATDNVPGHHG